MCTQCIQREIGILQLLSAIYNAVVQLGRRARCLYWEMWYISSGKVLERYRKCYHYWTFPVPFPTPLQRGKARERRPFPRLFAWESPGRCAVFLPSRRPLAPGFFADGRLDSFVLSPLFSNIGPLDAVVAAIPGRGRIESHAVLLPGARACVPSVCNMSFSLCSPLGVLALNALGMS